MVTSQKPTAPVASPNAKSNLPVARTTPPVTPAHSAPTSGGPDSTCAVHRLEEALQLVESMKLTNEQKTKIAQLTAAQTARCAATKKLHQETHGQILALLTADQNEMLQASADEAHHCRSESEMTLEGHAVHA